MQKTLYILLLISAFGCVKPKAELEVYFDLKSLLAAQAQQLAEGNFALQKSVKVADSSETKTLTLDSAEWMDQFGLLLDFSLTEPSLTGAFDVSKTDTETTYTLKADQRAAIKRFAIIDENQDQIMNGYLEETKTIYSNAKRMTLQLSEGTLSSFEVAGWQKMITRDTLKYSIEAKVIAQ